MFINTYGMKDVYNKGWQRKVYLTGNKINSNIISEVQQLDKNTYTQDICDNYVKVITNQKRSRASYGLLALFIPIWYYSYKEYIVSKADLDKATGAGE